MNSRLTPTDSFPENLVVLEDIEVHVLHSRVQRQLDHEHAHLTADPQTLIRNEDPGEELDRRHLQTSLWRPLLRFMTGTT